MDFLKNAEADFAKQQAHGIAAQIVRLRRSLEQSEGTRAAEIQAQIGALQVRLDDLIADEPPPATLRQQVIDSVVAQIEASAIKQQVIDEIQKRVDASPNESADPATVLAVIYELKNGKPIYTDEVAQDDLLKPPTSLTEEVL